MQAADDDAHFQATDAAARAALMLDKEVHRLWLAFITFFAALIIFTGICFVRTDGSIPSARVAVQHCVFWFVGAFCFNAFLLGYLGTHEAESWLIGYALEYMLSFDNLFVFHLVFTAYRAPQAQIHRGIFFGMCWGTWVRLSLYVIGEELFNSTQLFKWVFGSVLFYSGVKVIFFDDDDDSDPTDNIIVRTVARCIPLYPHYTHDCSFFVCIDEAQAQKDAEHATVVGCAESADEIPAGKGADEEDLEAHKATHEEKAFVKTSTSAVQAVKTPESIGRGSWKATPLLLALVTLLVIDALLSMDSVTAKVSMVSQYDDRIDLFLNFTSTAFAMLCMPNLYFVIELMIPLFRFLKYGIGTILILIGLKLLLARYVNVREEASCIMMVCIISFSILLSLLIPENEAEMEEKELGELHTNHAPIATDDLGADEQTVDDLPRHQASATLEL